MMLLSKLTQYVEQHKYKEITLIATTQLIFWAIAPFVAWIAMSIAELRGWSVFMCGLMLVSPLSGTLFWLTQSTLQHLRADRSLKEEKLEKYLKTRLYRFTLFHAAPLVALLITYFIPVNIFYKLFIFFLTTALGVSLILLLLPEFNIKHDDKVSPNDSPEEFRGGGITTYEKAKIRSRERQKNR